MAGAQAGERKGGGEGAYKDGQEEGEGKAAGADTHIRIVGPKEQGNEDHHIEACKRPDPLRRPAHIDCHWNMTGKDHWL